MQAGHRRAVDGSLLHPSGAASVAVRSIIAIAR
jgi:hypothetical protein